MGVSIPWLLLIALLIFTSVLHIAILDIVLRMGMLPHLIATYLCISGLIIVTLSMPSFLIRLISPCYYSLHNKVWLMSLRAWPNYKNVPLQMWGYLYFFLSFPVKMFCKICWASCTYLFLSFIMNVSWTSFSLWVTWKLDESTLVCQTSDPSYDMGPLTAHLCNLYLLYHPSENSVAVF